MSKRSTRSFDPGTSVLWLLLPVIGAIVGAAIPYLNSLDKFWSVIGPLLGAFVGFVPALKSWISARARNKWITEVSGDSGPIGEADLNSLCIHRSDRDVKDYVRRDAHDKLHDFLKDRTPVLVEGPSMAGKTRLVVEVLREEWPDARVLFPKSKEDVEKLLKNWRRPVRGAIIFLDELERFLGKEEFTLGVLNKWIDDSCIVVATTTHMNYTRWRKDLDSKFPGWDIFNRFHPLPLETKLSKHELEAVGNTSYAGDLPSIEQLGLGRVLGRAEDIRRRFTSALDSHQGRAGLVKAAVDWSRAGLGAASKETLLTLAKACDDDLWEEPDWEAEWSWVIGETATDAPLVLRTGKDSWEALDLIVEEADWPLTNTTLTTMATCPHTAFQAVTLVFKMRSKNLLAGGRATESLVQEAADLLQEISSANPTNADFLCFYTFLLTDIRQDYDRAEEIYEKAIKAGLNDVIILSSYAIFLTDIRRDHDRAEELYKKAIKADPNNAITLGNYASFLKNIRRDHDRAEELYKKAITINPNNANTLGNYANFLKNIRRDHNQAEELYKKAIKAGPNDAITLGNYAIFLTDIRCDHDRAEKLYKRALAIDPNNANILDSYAVFLKNIRQKYDRAEELYKKAITIDPNNANTLGNYAIFLTHIRHNYNRAEKLYKKAIKADPNNANTLGGYANFLTGIRHNHDRAEKLYEQAIKADPNDAIYLGNYSQLLFVTGRDEKGAKFTERALGLAERGQEALCAECHFYLFMHSPRHRTASGRALKALLADGVTTGGWSFEENLERLTQEEDPRYELAREVAEALRTGDTSALNDFEEWRDLDLPDREE
ncbi:tetratricopeptide repeat protein [Arachnia propionica]|uniref:tetratricopeptide repeat protein n=1 Tax=Arachnia propionica TaxID=1750 RepID=UPI00026D3C35|nr:tetratricopeptide repeat protein [Arachnia propionica]AFN44976.1 Sel1 repeat protein [Arachnia propionica F0230a]QCT36687.1 tetratricopeptide repeat protein [Arachnia propionica]RPA17849.1 tetratricopeptide repeat protein [Arachnia propionica]